MNLFPFPILAVFGWDDVLYYAVILGIQASATYASYSAQQQTAKQAGLNAEAQARQEAMRAAAEREAAMSFENAARSQALQRELALRSVPLNEIIGLMGGSQIMMPQFGGYQPTPVAPAPMFGAAQAAVSKRSTPSRIPRCTPTAGGVDEAASLRR